MHLCCVFIWSWSTSLGGIYTGPTVQHTFLQCRCSLFEIALTLQTKIKSWFFPLPGEMFQRSKAWHIIFLPKFSSSCPGTALWDCGIMSTLSSLTWRVLKSAEPYDTCFLSQYLLAQLHFWVRAFTYSGRVGLCYLLADYFVAGMVYLCLSSPSRLMDNSLGLCWNTKHASQL